VKREGGGAGEKEEQGFHDGGWAGGTSPAFPAPPRMRMRSATFGT
jgi:hypothetical protein